MAEEIVLNDQNVPRPPLQDELSRLYCQGSLTDITLTTEDGKNFEAHKIILAARSNYFYTIVPKLKSEAVIFLKGIKGAHLDKILKYIYSGSVAVSRHQLKPILDAAKCLQIKGIGDADPTEILSQQAQPSSSASAAAAVLASRFKQPETPPSMSPMVARPSSQMNFFLPQPQPLFVNSMPTLQNSGPVSASLRSNSFGTKAFSPIKSGNLNGSAIFESSDSDSTVEEYKPKPEVEEVPVEKPKRKRGRPPKSAKIEKPQEKSQGDPYNFETENNDQITKDDKLRRKNPSDKKEVNENNEPYTSTINGNLSKDELARDAEQKLKSHMNTINGKKTLTVKCKNHIGELHISRFANGMRGRCIRYKEEWMTPVDFELACGSNGKKYLENIHTDFGPLRTLTASGMLKPHSKKCRCSICRRDMTPEKAEHDQASKSKQRPKKTSTVSEEEDGGIFKSPTEEGIKEKSNGVSNFEERKLGFQSKLVDTSDSDSDDSSDSDFESCYKKDMDQSMRKKRLSSRDDWRKQLNDQIRQHQQQHQEQQFQHQQFQIGGFSFDQQDHSHHIQMSMSQDPLGLTGASLGAIMMAPSQDHQQKLTQQVILSDRIEPPQHLQTPTFYVMSPHPSMSTPHHNPFASVTPAPTPAPQLTHMSPPPVPAMTSKSSNLHIDQPKLAPVLNVRCKSTTAQLYKAKYESGSKGKCILLADEWLTPNEFEDRAGSKAKKYLSSIKCMGRPLRVYVNSGQLKGSGTPPSATKTKKTQSMKTGTATIPVNIAPAPTHSPFGGSMHGQQTPQHISSAPPIPTNLGMMMASPHNATQIILNQTSSLMGSQQILAAPMTFTLAQPMEVRQSVTPAM